MHVVARAERAVVVDQELGHDEERDSLHALGRVRRAREHEVDDVLGVVVLAERDEDLLAAQLVGAVALRHGARAHGGEVGTGLRFGQVHRAGPRAGNHVGQVLVLERFRAFELNRLDRALREQRAQVEGQVRRVPHFLDGRLHQLRQALPAVFRILGEPVPAVVAELLVRLLESRRRPDGAVRQKLRTFAVPRNVERIEDVGREFRGFVENGRDGVGRRVFEPGELRDLLQAGQFVQDELQFGEGGVIGAHACDPRWTLGCDDASLTPRLWTKSSKLRTPAGAQVEGVQPSAAVSSGTSTNRSPTRP